MNPRLARLQPYPFEKLRALLAGVEPNPDLAPINLSIGEPKHPTPMLVREALAGALDGLAAYPATAGLPELREAIADWLKRRHGLAQLDPATQVLPVNGSREALFAFAQTVIDGSSGDAWSPARILSTRSTRGALLAGRTGFYQCQSRKRFRIDPRTA